MKPTVSREADQLINAQAATNLHNLLFTSYASTPLSDKDELRTTSVCVKIASADVRPLSIRIGSDPREEEEALGSRAIKLGLPHVIVTPSIIAARDASYEHGVWLLGQAGIMEHQKMWHLL